MEDKLVESKKGFVTYFLIVLQLYTVGVSLYILINIFQTADYFSVDTFLVGPFVFAIVFASCWLTSSVLTTKVRVSPQSLTYCSCWSQRTLDWKDFEAVNAVPTFFGRYLIQIEYGNKRHFSLTTAHFSNHDILLKAVADAAYRANPDVKLNAWLEAEYGKPPYGIFKREGLK